MKVRNKKQQQVPQLGAVKYTEKITGMVKGYAVNTFHGVVKKFNEDRVSIIMSITKPKYQGRWPKCSYFAVFDGHGGDACSNFLKDHLHRFITQSHHFPEDPIEALKSGFRKAELQFLSFAQSQIPLERSGSCAIVVMTVDNICYIANVGDSRAIINCENGKKILQLSKDHKPDFPSQKQRIEKAGGCIYQSTIKTKSGEVVTGPFRIHPGKLSVSRTIGDIEGKLQKFGGNSKALIAKPEITFFQIKPDIHDFIIMGSDGIFDKLTNYQISQTFWQQFKNKKTNGLDFVGEVTSQILINSMKKLSMDNLTALVIVFNHNKFESSRQTITENISANKRINFEFSQKKNKIQTQEYSSNIMKKTQKANRKGTQYYDQNMKVSPNGRYSLKKNSSNSFRMIKNQRKEQRSEARRSTRVRNNKIFGMR